MHIYIHICTSLVRGGDRSGEGETAAILEGDKFTIVEVAKWPVAQNPGKGQTIGEP